LESNQLLIEIPEKYTEGNLPQQITQPLRCNIWGYTEKNCRTKMSSDINNGIELDEMTRSLADFFGMVHFTSKPSQEYADNMMVHQTLVTAMKNDVEENAEPISIDHFREFIDISRHTQVFLGKQAEKLIRGYYVSSRRVRAASVHDTAFPVSAVQTITSMAVAHAKLSMRKEAKAEDAVLAIYLYEEYITSRYGYSVLNVDPCPHIRDNNLDSYIGHKHNQHMQQFYVHLVRFCSIHAGEGEFTFHEE
ncbi:unnamed protein product, partial [Owenia fusiformis]